MSTSEVPTLLQPENQRCESPPVAEIIKCTGRAYPPEAPKKLNRRIIASAATQPPIPPKFKLSA